MAAANPLPIAPMDLTAYGIHGADPGDGNINNANATATVGGKHRNRSHRHRKQTRRNRKHSRKNARNN
jgi:hypothetical protein